MGHREGSIRSGSRVGSASTSAPRAATSICLARPIRQDRFELGFRFATDDGMRAREEFAGKDQKKRPRRDLELVGEAMDRLEGFCETRQKARERRRVRDGPPPAGKHSARRRSAPTRGPWERTPAVRVADRASSKPPEESEYPDHRAPPRPLPAFPPKRRARRFDPHLVRRARFATASRRRRDDG